MLVDHLEDRYETTTFVEVDSDLELLIHPDYRKAVKANGSYYDITDSAFYALLNFLRIPIKYIERCQQDTAGLELAISNINYWIGELQKFSLLIECDKVTQIFDGKRLYMPGIKVNDIIVDMLPDVKVVNYTTDQDIFHALYVSDRTQNFDGFRAQQGIRALFSDCFNVTPRFDAVLYEPETQTMYCWPVQGRKFRAASTTLSQVVDQIEDFIVLVLEQMHAQLVPAIAKANASTKEYKTTEFVQLLSSELRLNKRQQQELDSAVPEAKLRLIDIVRRLGSYTNDHAGEQHISLLDAREVQVALSYYLVRGSFK